MAGYPGGVAGPLAIRWVLDRAGGMATTGWGVAFLHIALVGLIGQAAFVALRPRDVAGDRSRVTTAGAAGERGRSAPGGWK